MLSFILSRSHALRGMPPVCLEGKQCMEAVDVIMNDTSNVDTNNYGGDIDNHTFPVQRLGVI